MRNLGEKHAVQWVKMSENEVGMDICMLFEHDDSLCFMCRFLDGLPEGLLCGDPSILFRDCYLEGGSVDPNLRHGETIEGG